MTTNKQKRAIAFCNLMCYEKFEGDLNNFKEVSDYLSKHLNEAKMKERELSGKPKTTVLATTRYLDYMRYMDDDIDPYIEDALFNDMFN